MSTLVILSLSSRAEEKANQIKVSYDAFGQVVLTSFDTSLPPGESWGSFIKMIKEYYGDEVYRLSTKEEATWLIEQLASLQGRVNFVLSRIPIRDIEDSEDIHRIMDDEGYGLCLLFGLGQKTTRNQCYSIDRILLEKMSTEEMNKMILSALEKKYNAVNSSLRKGPSLSPVTMAAGVDDAIPRYPMPEETLEYIEWLEVQLRELCSNGGCSSQGVSKPTGRNGRWYVAGHYKQIDGSEDDEYHAAYF